MQFSKTWLQTFFAKSLDDYDLSYLLTMAGLEVDEVLNLDTLSDQIIVGEIVGIEKHPNADKLNICEVNIGQKNSLQIVCGAPNARKGIKIPCALVGAKLPEFEIKKAKLRGVDSFGMLCSAREIGLQSDENDGLYELSQNLEVGLTIKEALSLTDKVYTLSITPNRGDCLSMLGIAREISAQTKLNVTNLIVPETSHKFNNSQKVLIEEKNACPRYCGIQIKNINNTGKLPQWMISYLERGGIGSINPVVDITNFVMLEQGQPLHAFDQKKINGDICVRRAKIGESLMLLNEQKINFMGPELLIADNDGPLALAGIIGGIESSITPETSEVFLESAFFQPEEIAGRARSFALNTDSSHRFERGVDYNNTLRAIYRAVNLIEEFCGGEHSDAIDLVDKLPTRNLIKLRLTKINKILGIDIKELEVEDILKRLNLSFSKKEDHFEVTAPSYRFDLNIEADLIEEVIRLFGYNNIPAITPQSTSSITKTSAINKNLDEIKLHFSNLGYNEVVTYSFIDKESEEKLHENKNIIELNNPIASQMNSMRSKLWASHLETLTYNVNRSQSQVRIFEIASTYHKHNNEIVEEQMVSGLAYGSKYPEQWSEEKKSINFYNIKGDIELISCNLLDILSPKSSIPTALHPGQTGEIFREGNHVGWLGQLHPAWQQKYSLDDKAYLFEFKINSINKSEFNAIELPSKLMPIRRDISVLIDKNIPVASVTDEVKSQAIKWLVDFYPFDIYEGKGIENNKKSIAFLILMQDTYKTLEDNDVNKIVDQVLNILQSKFSATLR